MNILIVFIFPIMTGAVVMVRMLISDILISIILDKHPAVACRIWIIY